MSYEPLSPSTRRSRASLLVFASTLAAVSGFGVSITTVEGFVVAVDFPDDVAKSFLAFATIYFAIAFAAYAWEDLQKVSGPEIRAGITAEEVGKVAHLSNILANLDRDPTEPGSTPHLKSLNNDAIINLENIEYYSVKQFDNANSDYI